MDTMPLSFVIFGAIPEALLMMYFGLTIIGIKPKPIKVTIAAILQGIAIFFIRKYASFGPHVIIASLSLCIITWLIVRVTPMQAFIASILSLVVNVLIEGPYSLAVQGITGLTYVEILSREWLRVVYFIPKLLIQASLIIFCVKFHFTIEEELNILKRLGNQFNQKL